VTPTDRDPDSRHPDDGAQSRDGKLSGRGCDDLHRHTGFGSETHQDVDRPGAARPGDPIAAGVAEVDDLSPLAARRYGGGQLGPTPSWPRGRGGGIPKARPGWYAYRAIGMAELPSWAMEVALTIERPVDPDPLGSAALVLLRATLAGGWRGCLTEAVAEVERLAGVGPIAGVDTVAGARPGPGSRLLPGPELAGLRAVTPSVAQASLAAAGTRGLPAPLRRRHPSAAELQMSWRWSAGAVVTCDGPCGLSAQAVVALGGQGNVAAITPPPGGALVLRAWRARHTWGMACGLVVGAAATLGLGREAGRAAARARAGGWDAVLLTGPTALGLARAGSPAQPAPVHAARAASGAQVAAMFEACLAAGDVSHRPAGSQRALWVTP
jgi:hypothetical protein